MAYNFSWIVPDRVAGMARPGRDDIAWLIEQGVTAIVSLTERPLQSAGGIDVLHVPVVDMTAPSLGQLHRLIEFMRGVVAEQGKVVAHCAAGIGRTGTVLAAYLVSEGMTATEAIDTVRSQRPGSIETRSQEQAVQRYAELTGGNK